MKRRQQKRAGFTLVELAVVVMILGILAAVAAPKFLNTSASACDNGLRTTLSIVRDAVELYAANNGGALPPCTGTGADFKTALTPYLRGAFPKCPMGPAKGTDTITPVTGATTSGDAAPTVGWKFNTTNGTFIANYNGVVTSMAGTNYDQL